MKMAVTRGSISNDGPHATDENVLSVGSPFKDALQYLTWRRGIAFRESQFTQAFQPPCFASLGIVPPFLLLAFQHSQKPGFRFVKN